MRIENITEEHYSEVAKIYLEGIATGNATLETKAPSWHDWDKSHLQIGRIAAFDGNEMCGWASLSPVSSRCVYGGVAEVSIYIGEQHRNKKVGKFLLTKLIEISEENDMWMLQAGMFSENISSKILHEKCGFRLVGYREKIGYHNGVWRDNLLMERRSKIVGV